eukprot:1357967-Pleurochrysis_carterae.AAC.2
MGCSVKGAKPVDKRLTTNDGMHACNTHRTFDLVSRAREVQSRLCGARRSLMSDSPSSGFVLTQHWPPAKGRDGKGVRGARYGR